MEVLIKEIIHRGRNYLRQAGVWDADNDSWLLAEYVFRITRTDFYRNPQLAVEEKQAEKYFTFIKKRADKIPLQYLTGMQEFMGLEFQVNENVLIPRQDTELLVETAAEYIRSRKKNVRVLDLCTGSGCIAISLDLLCPAAEVTASDISGRALQTARENNRRNHAEVKFIRSDIFSHIQGKYDLIVSNPPYIPTEVIHTLMEEVREHEPWSALDGDRDGLKFYREISAQAGKYLNKNGMIMYEIGFDQGESVPEILKKSGYKEIKVFRDLSGNDRVVTAGKE